ncbi:hypothetical protein P7D93_18750 [Enterococcus raffinosus]|uniref:hypothetical protein n=1 Tax=Enterococcus raffinosus TaxID=71452 RepID=UPI00288CADE8|nr:hypothetical protein [Enterococcus raffinosus]MDT2531902.1 hypothetical protein [Enterococcus raffinosus]
MTEFSKKELEALLKDTEEHLAETKRLGPGYYGIRERYDYAVEADERYIEKLKRQIADYDLNRFNENQQVVLEWLKQVSGTEGSLTRALYSLYHLNLVRKEYFDNLTIDSKEHQLEVRSALRNLSRKQEAQILTAFAEWGNKE